MAVLRYFHQAPKTTTSTTVVDNTAVQTITAALNTKADKVVGKGFSQNNYSTIEKTKLSGIEEGAEVNVQSDWNEIDPESDAFILNKPDIPILDLSGLIPARYLPSYVDDVLEYSSTSAFPNPGETGKIYVDTSTDLTYRWSGSTYVEISKSILTGVKGDAESTYRVGNVNLTATNIGLGNVANIDLSKAIKSITRSGTTFTYTCLDGTTGTFTQQDDNTTYSAGTGLSLNGTTFSLALTKKLVTDALGYTPPTTDTNTTYSAGSGLSLSGTTFSLSLTKSLVTTALGYTPPTSDTNTWRPITNTYTGSDLSTSVSQYGTNALYNALVNGYASSAGNADTVDSEHASAFAHVAAHNNLTASGNEFTTASSGFSGDYYWNYRTAGGTNGNITRYNFCDGKGGTLASITSGTFNGNCTGSAGSVAWGNVSGRPTIPSGTQIVLSGTNPDNFGNMNTIFTVGDDMYINVLKSSSGVAYLWRFSADGYMYVRKRRDWVNWNSWVTMQNLQPI